MRTKRRIVVITGASSGLGKGLKEQFEKKGDIVVDISLDGRDYECDVSDSKRLNEVFEDIKQKFGHVDILVTCAGYGISGAVELLDEKACKKQCDVNFFGTAFACKYVIPMLSPRGKIVIISSAAALFPLPFKTYYCASKAAVDSFAQGLRMELSKTKIQVTSICPGDVRTNFSENRVKMYDTNERYGDAIDLSTRPTEKTEKRRMKPEYAVSKMMKICEKEKLKPRYIVGNQYHFFNFARKILPKSAMVKILTKIFYKTKAS